MDSTDVGGSIFDNITWTLAESPYIVISDVTVESNASLTIEPGTVVRFSSGTNLIVNGLLIARGNQTDVIEFTSNSTLPVAGDWGTIRISDGGSADICYASVQYASTGIDYQKKGSNSLENINLTRNSVGLFLNAEYAELELKNCTISDNLASGFQLKRSAGATIIDTEIMNNQGRGVSGGSYYGNELIMDRSVVSNNSRGGLFQISMMWVNNSEITHNGVGGIVSDYIVCRNCSVCYNSGWGIFVTEGVLDLTFCKIAYNGAPGITGAMRDWSIGLLGQIHYCDIHHNGRDFGGDINNDWGPGWMDWNATFCWWGTTNETLIRQRGVGGHVFYVPYLNASVLPELMGDINDDRVVDIHDAMLLASAFATVRGDPTWNLLADLNYDWAIDICDAIMLALHFNQTLP